MQCDHRKNDLCRLLEVVLPAPWTHEAPIPPHVCWACPSNTRPEGQRRPAKLPLPADTLSRCPRCQSPMEGGCRRACPRCHFEEGCGRGVAG